MGPAGPLCEMVPVKAKLCCEAVAQADAKQQPVVLYRVIMNLIGNG